MTYERLKAAYDPDEPAKVQQVFQQSRTPPPPGVRYPCRMPMGRFELVLREGFTPTKGILDVTSGVLTVQVAKKRETRAVSFALHPARPLLLVDDPAKMITLVQPRPAWEWLGEEMSKYRFIPPTMVASEGLTGWGQECPDDPAMAAVARSAGTGLVIAMCPGTTAAAARSAAVDETRRVSSRKAFLAETRAWWQAYWKDKPVLSLPSRFFASFVDYALFRFAGASSPNSVLPCALQGPWVEEYQFPPWSGDYTVNENIQQIYTLAFPCGAVEHLMPLFDWLDSLRDVMRRNAKVLFGIDDGLLLTHSVDDRGAILQGGLSTMGTLDQGCLGWLAKLYWLYYRHTGDTEFLRRRAMPFMEGVMRVYQAMLEPDGDQLSLRLSVSPEFGQPLPCTDPNQYYSRLVRNGKNSSFQLACIHMLADMLLEASAALGKAPEKIWTTIKKKVPPYSLVGAAHNRRRRLAGPGFAKKLRRGEPLARHRFAVSIGAQAPNGSNVR